METTTTQLISKTSGNAIANQFVIYTEKGTAFQSYNIIIVFIPLSGKTQLDKTYWNYSKTTSKYRNQFLNETTKETEKKIKSGEYILKNLN